MQEPVGLGSTSPSLQSASEKRHSRLESKSLSLENKFKSKATFKQGVPRNIAGFLLSILVVFVLATYVILIGASHLFGANAIDVMDLDEVLRRAGIPESAGIGSTNATLQHLGASAPYIPRIVHQTWKVDQVPDQWQPVRQHCMDLLPDFEFRMWSDIESRRFIQDHYPFFVKTWDSYPYNIQRADAIRYFVLHKYGGVYMDLDIGCRRHPEPLMHYGTILPITKPVGMSNDLMFSPPGSDFMNMVIHSLPNWNRRWLLLPYPTVIMSTGPLFISAMYARWSRSMKHDNGTLSSTNKIWLLPKSLYGKHISPENAPHSFFWHYYGSTWHAGDAGFINLLGVYGFRLLLFVSFIMVCIVGAWLRHRSSSPQAVSFDDNPASHIQRKFEGNAESKGFWTGILEILHNIRKAPLASAHLGSAQSPNYRDKAEGTIPVHTRGGNKRTIPSRQRSRDVERNSQTNPRNHTIFQRAWSSSSVFEPNHSAERPQLRHTPASDVFSPTSGSNRNGTLQVPTTSWETRSSDSDESAASSTGPLLRRYRSRTKKARYSDEYSSSERLDRLAKLNSVQCPTPGSHIPRCAPSAPYPKPLLSRKVSKSAEKPE